jgi:hypothetical protein
MVIADVAMFRKAQPAAGNEYASHPQVSSLKPTPSPIASTQNITPIINKAPCIDINTGR